MATHSQINYAIRKIEKALSGEAVYEEELDQISFTTELLSESESLDVFKEQVTQKFEEALPSTWSLTGRSLDNPFLTLNAKLIPINTVESED